MANYVKQFRVKNTSNVEENVLIHADKATYDSYGNELNASAYITSLPSSANWDSTYGTVSSYSADWNTDYSGIAPIVVNNTTNQVSAQTLNMSAGSGMSITEANSSIVISISGDVGKTYSAGDYISISSDNTINVTGLDSIIRAGNGISASWNASNSAYSIGLSANELGYFSGTSTNASTSGDILAYTSTKTEGGISADSTGYITVPSGVGKFTISVNEYVDRNIVSDSNNYILNKVTLYKVVNSTQTELCCSQNYYPCEVGSSNVTLSLTVDHSVNNTAKYIVKYNGCTITGKSSPVNATVSIIEQSMSISSNGGSGGESDHKVMVYSSDTEPDYLAGKIIGGENITTSIDAENNTLILDSPSDIDDFCTPAIDSLHDKDFMDASSSDKFTLMGHLFSVEAEYVPYVDPTVSSNSDTMGAIVTTANTDAANTRLAIYRVCSINGVMSLKMVCCSVNNDNSVAGSGFWRTKGTKALKVDWVSSEPSYDKIEPGNLYYACVCLNSTSESCEMAGIGLGSIGLFPNITLSINKADLGTYYTDTNDFVENYEVITYATLAEGTFSQFLRIHHINT